MVPNLIPSILEHRYKISTSGFLLGHDKVAEAELAGVFVLGGLLEGRSIAAAAVSVVVAGAEQNDYTVLLETSLMCGSKNWNCELLAPPLVTMHMPQLPHLLVYAVKEYHQHLELHIHPLSQPLPGPVLPVREGMPWSALLLYMKYFSQRNSATCAKR